VLEKIVFLRNSFLALPISPFLADSTEVSDGLLLLMFELEKILKTEDVRIYLNDRYKILATLRESKLIK
jgi:hypothetical protein